MSFCVKFENSVFAFVLNDIPLNICFGSRGDPLVCAVRCFTRHVCLSATEIHILLDCEFVLSFDMIDEIVVMIILKVRIMLLSLFFRAICSSFKTRSSNSIFCFICGFFVSCVHEPNAITVLGFT